MRMEKLTNQLQSALSEAQSIAIGNDHTAIESEHLLLALLDQQGGSVRPILNRLMYPDCSISSMSNLKN